MHRRQLQPLLVNVTKQFSSSCQYCASFTSTRRAIEQKIRKISSLKRFLKHSNYFLLVWNFIDCSRTAMAQIHITYSCSFQALKPNLFYYFSTQGIKEPRFRCNGSETEDAPLSFGWLESFPVFKNASILVIRNTLLCLDTVKGLRNVVSCVSVEIVAGILKTFF